MKRMIVLMMSLFSLSLLGNYIYTEKDLRDSGTRQPLKNTRNGYIGGQPVYYYIISVE